ncbi:YggS family pyridoxal phosphate-dependent enzyme [Candidatus Protochlamydia sp. R18]|uniref:YggS family pyridoxal phosphate-dependent enzyme n=1 Tax=Candidatus Protochlamydia sp. R18 TaxID=1353977 RepID=UPI0006950899|nr:YggS family pyridoxal phosphate-dependent enzyme [Candidatus Protochlamydia sp. R18]
MQNTIVERYQKIQEEVISKMVSSGRDPQDVNLIVVSKNQPITAMQDVYQAGCRQFGENRVMEALAKIPEMPKDIQWHLIGTLQSNKVAKILNSSISLIHSVHSFSLAKKISEGSLQKQKITSILLQVNVSKEESKQGLTHDEWEKLLAPLQELSNLRIEGLMTIAPHTADLGYVRFCFRQLFELREKWKKQMNNPTYFKHLSMGMTNDYLIAIEEGATLLRIGSGIFGH